MPSKKKTLFLDTMVFLHYRQIDEVDWLGLFGATDVRLVIAPIVWRQIDRHKDTAREGLRARAKTTVATLTRLLNDAPTGPIRAGVTLELVYRDPLIDFERHQLSWKVEDDQLIASMLQYRIQESCDDPPMLVSEDPMLRQKAIAAGFVAVPPSEDTRLPLVPSEGEKRIRELESQLRAVSNQRSKLQLVFADGASRQTFRIKPAKPLDPSLRAKRRDEVRTHLPLLPDPPPIQYPTVTLDTVGSVVGRSGLEIALDPMRDRNLTYNKELRAYYGEFDAYLDREAAFDALQARTLRFKLRLENVGSASARDIDISLETEANVHAFRDGDRLLDPPDTPEPPEKPTSPWYEPKVPEFAQHPALPRLPRPRGPSLQIKNTNSGVRVEIGLRKLKQNNSTSLPEFVFLFPEVSGCRSFGLTYVINSEDAGEDQEGRLDFILEHVLLGEL